MGLLLKEQKDNRHPKADDCCEGCHGAGWLVALVDDKDWLDNAKVGKPSDFVMACNECEVMDDQEAIVSARKAGMNVDDSGLVQFTVEQLLFLEEQDAEMHLSLTDDVMFGD